MKTEIIKHSYFPEGALLLIVNGEVAILYQTGKNSALHLWMTYQPYTDMEAVNKLLSECAQFMHSDLGTSVSGSLQDIIEALEPAPQTNSGRLKRYMLLHEHQYGQTPYTFQSELGLEELTEIIEDVCDQLSVDWDRDDDREGVELLDITDGLPTIVRRTEEQTKD